MSVINTSCVKINERLTKEEKEVLCYVYIEKSGNELWDIKPMKYSADIQNCISVRL